MRPVRVRSDQLAPAAYTSLELARVGGASGSQERPDRSARTSVTGPVDADRITNRYAPGNRPVMLGSDRQDVAPLLVRAQERQGVTERVAGETSARWT